MFLNCYKGNKAHFINNSHYTQTQVTVIMSDFNLNDKVKTKEEAIFLLNEDKWKHRRNIAYKSFYAVIAITLVVLISAITGIGVANFSSIESFMITVIVGLISVIGFYYGVTGWYDAAKKKQGD